MRKFLHSFTDDVLVLELIDGKFPFFPKKIEKKIEAEMSYHLYGASATFLDISPMNVWPGIIASEKVTNCLNLSPR
jgi:hypothetical protein